MADRTEKTCRAARAMEVVNAGPGLREEAAGLTDDVNEAYLLVHEAVSRALAEPGCAEVSPYALSQEMSGRFVDGPGDPPESP